MARSLGRIVFALMGAAFGAVAVALAEARFAIGVLAEGRALPLRDVALAELGVLAPLALVVGFAVALAALFLEPGRAVSPVERVARLRAQPVLERSRTASLAFLGFLAAVAWLVVTAHLGRAFLSDGAPLAAGVALATVAMATLLGVGAVGFALLPVVRRVLAGGASRASLTIDPALLGGVGLVVAAGVVAAGVTSGDTGGEGAGPLAIFGVLKRGELDLRPVAYLAVIAACAWVAPLALRGRAARPVPLILALAFVVAPLVVTVREARALDAQPAVARAVEGHAPLGHVGLALARKATDRDHDGASPYFGGGDCNDRDPAISPLAVDIPGNGIDEDCSGADLPLPAKGPAPVVAPPPAQRVDRDYNLIFITVDTLRAGELGFLGCPRATSPRLDALAAESVVFERTYAMASYTGKALAPMLIGKYPSETARDGGHFNVYAPSNVFLAERLRGAGFVTMGAASHWYFKPQYGVTQGFDRFDLSAMPTSGQTDTDSTTTAAQLTDAGEKLLGDGGQKRFMLWVHYFDPHLQYVPHAGAPDFSDPAHPAGWKQRAAYDGEVWFTDEQIGRLLDYARDQPWWKDTVVVVTSDHGEAFGEHGINFQHGWEIWEPLMRVPLVMRVPGVAPHRISAKRSAIDIVPTVLDLMRVAPPQPGELSGQSMLRDIFAKPGESPEERDVYLDMPDGPYTHMRRGIIHGPTPGQKLINFGGRQYQLYDLSHDPDEKEDLSGDPSKLAPMIDAFQAKRATLHEIQVKADVPGGP